MRQLRRLRVPALPGDGSAGSHQPHTASFLTPREMCAYFTPLPSSYFLRTSAERSTGRGGSVRSSWLARTPTTIFFCRLQPSLDQPGAK